jgi:hypothetical protein
MPASWLKYVVVVVLLVCVAGPIAELFDHWDPTTTTGGDTEFNIIVIALTIGTVFAIISVIRALLGARSILLRFSPLMLADEGASSANRATSSPFTSVLRV